MIKAIIFDLDGTLTDTLATIAHFGNFALESCGLPAIPVNRYRRLVGNGRDLLIHRMLAEHNADTDENYQRVGAIYDREYEADVLYGTKPYAGILPLLDALKSAGLLLCVLSNKPHNVVCGIVDKIFGNRFDIVYGQRTGIPIKPSPEGTLDICRELSLQPSECLFAGDTHIDIETAKNAHMASVGVLWGFRDFAELQTAGADYIIERPAEIAAIIQTKSKNREQENKRKQEKTGES